MSKPSDIVMMDALALSRAIQSKQVSCVEVMNAYLDHIDALNPKVNAIVSLQDRGDVVAQASARDEQLSRGEVCGWMHGLPQAIKDLTATKGIRTTQGSRIFKDFVPTADAIHVERVKRAGAIIIGKTNTPEFGLGSNTYNDVFGRTLNAYDQSKTAGGSSGGAWRLGRAAHAAGRRRSDHGGSLRNPPPTTTFSDSARRSAGCRPMRSTASTPSWDARADGAERARPRGAVVGAGRLRSAAPLSNEQNPAPFAGRSSATSRHADRLGRRFRRPSAVRAGHPRSLQGGAEGV
jgi:hypothetical protein